MKIHSKHFQVPEGREVNLKKWPTIVDPVYKSKEQYRELLEKHVAGLSAQQQLLYSSNSYAVLLIFQAMDAAGKDGAIKHVMSGVNPQGCQVFSFKHPSPAELQHDFLWRTTHDLPERGRIADRVSISVREAGDLWLRRAEREDLENGTTRQYRQHLNHHINPLIGEMKLSRLTTPAVEKFRDDLLQKCSRPLTRAVLTSFKGVLKEARRLGLIGHDPAAHTTVKLSKDESRKREIPNKDQIRAILKGADMWPYSKVQRTRSKGTKTVAVSWRPLIITAVFTGMRCSELRGLTWDHVDLQEGIIKVRQRADFQNQMGTTKSRAGDRDIPMAPMVINTLRAWRLACPPWQCNLVFPTEKGTVHSNGNIHHYCWGPLLRKLGIVKPAGMTKNGESIMKPALTFHSLRHAAASLFIEQGWTAKKIQVVMGHSNISVTFNTYGHLWKDTKSDLDDMAQVEARLLA